MNANELQEIRDWLDLTQQAMAKALNVSFVTYNRWEKNHRAVPEDTSKLLDTIRLLLTPDVQKKTRLTLAEIREAVNRVGVQGVVATAAIRRLLPVSVIASLAVIPAYAWLAGAAGLVGLGALSFFTKSKARDSDVGKVDGDDFEHHA